MMMATRRTYAGRGFTLVELMIVLVILSILALIGIPLFTSAFSESRENSVKMNLHRIRIQLELYKNQHSGYPALADFEAQMTTSSNYGGDTAAVGTAGYPYGPYVARLPANPNLDNRNDVGDGDSGTSAWYYDETNGHFLANDSDESREF